MSEDELLELLQEAFDRFYGQEPDEKLLRYLIQDWRKYNEKRRI